MSAILLVPHPLLRQKSQPLKTVTKQDIELSKKMMQVI